MFGIVFDRHKRWLDEEDNNIMSTAATARATTGKSQAVKKPNKSTGTRGRVQDIIESRPYYTEEMVD